MWSPGCDVDYYFQVIALITMILSTLSETVLIRMSLLLLSLCIALCLSSTEFFRILLLQLRMGHLPRASTGVNPDEGGPSGSQPMFGPQRPHSPGPAPATAVRGCYQVLQAVQLPCGQRLLQEEPPLPQPMGVHVPVWEPSPGPRDRPPEVLRTLVS